MNDRLPKILTLTVDCWSNKTGANTFSNLFEWYNPKKLANIYIRADKPTSQVSDNYFQIIEDKVIASILSKSIKTGNKVSTNESDDNKVFIKEKKRYSFFKKHRLWIFIYIREILWKLGKWNSDELDEFINEFNPDIILFPVEGYIHFNRICEYVAEKYGNKTIGFLWDDNFTYKVYPYSMGFRIHRYFLRKSVRRLINICDNVLAISPIMKMEADKFFDIKSIVITKSVDKKTKENGIKHATLPLNMTYTGNLNVGRDKTLVEVVKVLSEINKEETKISLDIYTQSELSKKKLRFFEKTSFCRIHGSVTQEKVFEIQEKADILLVCEALKGKHKYGSRLSFSTKITDYFSRGKCILAVGAENVASMQYLRQNDCGIVVSDKKQLLEKIKSLLETPSSLLYYARKAQEIGIKYHSQQNIKNSLIRILDIGENYESVVDSKYGLTSNCQKKEFENE